MPEFAGIAPMMNENDELCSSCKNELREMAKASKVDPRLIDELLVREGPPHREITEAARTQDADLIVIATHGYTGLQHVLNGSVTERVVRHAACPVLVVREQERDFISPA